MARVLVFAGPLPAGDADMNFRLEGSVAPSERPDPDSTADHRKFEALQGPFANGSEVTAACLS